MALDLPVVEIRTCGGPPMVAMRVRGEWGRPPPEANIPRELTPMEGPNLAAAWGR